MASNIYYHFFDRELRESVHAAISDELLLEIISASVFMTDRVFYLPISHLYESGNEFPKAVEFIKKLDSMGLIYPVSSHSSRENFLLSRQYMYLHDKERYPMYYEDGTDTWSTNLLVFKDSTTKVLQEKLLEDKTDIPELERKSKDKVRQFVTSLIEDVKGKAITYALFKSEKLPDSLNNQEAKTTMQYIRYKISENYIRRYLESGQGTIISGIPGLNGYDYISEDSLNMNYNLYKIILECCGVRLSMKEDRKVILDIRNNALSFRMIYTLMTRLVMAVCECIEGLPIGRERRILDLLASGGTGSKAKTGEDMYRNLVLYIERLCKKNHTLKEKMDVIKDRGLVLVAVTITEMKAIKKAFSKYFPECFLKEHTEGPLVYRELVGDKKPFYIVQSQMGTTGSGAMNNTMHKIIEVLKPEKVILGGIAFGVDCKKQNLGDILVSNQVWNYEPSKVTEKEIISRGDKIPASSYLLQLMNSSVIDYEEAKVSFGLIASGEKLMNSGEAIQSLKEREPEFIGGDMEAAGIASVCQDNKIDWVVVKAICDWGVNKTDDAQQMAANHAFDFIMYNINKLI